MNCNLDPLLSDVFSNLYDHSRYSAGVGLRIFVNKNLPIRIESATGNEGESIYLTAGPQW